jgi:hypothetical protein
MLWIISTFLLLLWALAVVSAKTMGGAVHLLLAAAVVMVAVRVFRSADRTRVQR